MDILIFEYTGSDIEDATDYYPDRGPAIYEVIYPLTIEEVVSEFLNKEDIVAEWELSGQLVHLSPGYVKDKFKFYCDGVIAFYQKIKQ